jgi:amino acid adenylation domain-containing protein
MSKKNTEAVYPLSPAQQGMLFHTLYTPESGMYFQQMSTTLRGALDVAAFRGAWRQVVDRHAALRTLFAWDRGEQPLQIVRREVTLPWREEDWRDRPAAEQAAQLEALLAADRERGFNLNKAPLLRLTLIRLADAEYHLTWSFHHLVLDGWSLPLIFRDVFALYEAQRQGLPLALPRPRPYRDYISWLQRQDRAAAEAFWRRHLAGVVAPTPLGIDRQPRPGAPISDAAERTLAVSAELTADLQALARRTQVTLNTIVQAAWAILLSRYSAEQDVVFGITVAGRPSELAGVEEMVGMFINTTPIRVSAPPAAALSDWLKQLQAAQAELRQFEHSALIEVQGWSDVPRGLPLFESLFVFENYPTAAAADAQPGALTSGDNRTFERTNYPLTIIAAPGERLTLRIGYDADRFDERSIERLLGHFDALLSEMTRQPEQRLSALSPITAAEQAQLAAWNATAQPAPQHVGMAAYIEAQAARTPEAVALIDGRRRVSYRELNERANQLAHYLQAHGVGRDDREALVGVYLHRSLDLVVALLATLKAGGAYVPLDPNYPAERLQFILQDSRARVIVTEQALRESLPDHAATLVTIDRDWPQIAAGDRSNPPALDDSRRLAYLIYTSGSTGRPKGVAIQHHSAATFIEWARATFSDDELRGVLAATSICFDLSVFELFVPLSWGGAVILAPNALYLPTLPAAGEVTLINTVPSAMAELVRSGGVPAGVRTVNLAGEPLTARLSEAIYRETATERLYNLYGPSEDTTYSTFTLIPRDLDAAPTIGRPLANTQVYLLDAQLRPVPIGVAGELYIGGDGLARGYLDRPALTAEKFMPNPFSDRPGARLYRTGDLARWLPDGQLAFLGRIDHQIKLRGFRIELGEIETALQQHPDVQEAIVLLRTDQPDDPRLTAYIVAGEQRTENKGTKEPANNGTDHRSPTSDHLRAFLAQRLPEVFVPSAFVVLDSFPLTPNGKIDRKALPAPAIEEHDEQRFVAPRGPVEQVLAAIWSEVLHVERVGRDENFFALGGHSLLAIQIVTRIRAAFDVDLPLHHLFQAATIAGLAEQIELLLRAADGVQTPPIERISRDQALPLSFAQQRLWFLDQLDPHNPSYNIPFAVRLSGALDVIALQRSFAEIVRRHDVLRTTFQIVANQNVQVIAPSLDLPLTLVDLSAHDAEQREDQLQQTIQRWARQPFDLQHGPLSRAALVRLDHDEHVALVVLHHSIADGWSLGVLVRELAALYAAAGDPAAAALPALPIQYADYAHWQRGWLRGAILEQQLGYWKQHLAGAPSLLALPTDRPRAASQSDEAGLLTRVTAPALSAELSALGRREGVTLFMLGLAALQTLLQRYSGQQDIVVGTPTAGRTQAETEALIGCFINTLALRTSFEGQPTFREILQRVRQSALGAYAHQELPFEQLVEALQPSRDLSHTPIFQVMFVQQNTLMPTIELPGLRLAQIGIDTSAEQYDLSIALDDTDPAQGLTWTVKYKTALFDEPTIARLLDHLQTLLAAVVAQPERRVADLPLMSEAEQRILHDWNATARPYPTDVCLHELFEAQAARTPDATALVFEDQTLSYRELNERANQLAHALQAHGVGPETRVGVSLHRSFELVIALYAILKAGGAYVPLDPSYPADRLQFMLEDSQVAALLTETHILGERALPGVAVICVDRDADVIAQQPAQNPRSAVQPTNLAYVIYTSGSTGRPKGAMNSHVAIVNRLIWMQDEYQLTADDRGVQKTPFSFDVSVWEFFWPLIVGARLVVARPEGHKDPAYLAELIATQGITTIHFVPSMLSAFLEEPRVERCTSLKRVICSGEALPYEVQERCFARLAAAELHNLYGPTEAAVDVTYWACQRHSQQRSVPIGRPVANTQIHILDAQLRPAPIGVAGELHIGGVQLARGYLGRPALTAEKFIADPLSDQPGARLYKTGDLARWRNDGAIEYLGRIDHQVKLRGLRIELGEIETVLAQHPQVRETVVVARQDQPGDARLVAYIVPGLRDQGSGIGDEQADPSSFILHPSSFRDFLADKLPEYMIPSAFVTLPTLPLNPNGKVDRKLLPAPDWTQGERDQPFVAPRTPLEQELAALWSELLGVAQIGIYDNFFALGGHSLLLTQLASRIRANFQADISLRTLFNIPTIEEMTLAIAAAHVEQEDVGAVDELLAELADLDADEIAALLAAESAQIGL